MGHLREPLMECSLPAALEAMGERWSFLILRAAFNGLAHFEEFQSGLGIARNILANRLARLVEHGVPTHLREAAGQIHGCFNLRGAIPSAQADLLANLADLKTMLAEIAAA